jgi:hypothetical protein
MIVENQDEDTKVKRKRHLHFSGDGREKEIGLLEFIEES